MRDTPNWREIYRYLGYRNGARPEGAALENSSVSVSLKLSEFDAIDSIEAPAGIG